jgi:hypothetical protein
MKAGVSQLHLGLDTDDVKRVPTGEATGHVAQQGALAGTGFATQNQRLAIARLRVS